MHIKTPPALDFTIQNNAGYYACMFCRNGQAILLAHFSRRNGMYFPLPVVRDEQFEFSNVGRVFGEGDIACKLGRGKPEGEIGRLVQLEFCMDPGNKRY